MYLAARRSPLTERIVVASSDKAYGDQKQLPYDETMPSVGNIPTMYPKAVQI